MVPSFHLPVLCVLSVSLFGFPGGLCGVSPTLLSGTSPRPFEVALGLLWPHWSAPRQPRFSQTKPMLGVGKWCTEELPRLGARGPGLWGFVRPLGVACVACGSIRISVHTSSDFGQSYVRYDLCDGRGWHEGACRAGSISVGLRLFAGSLLSATTVPQKGTSPRVSRGC